MAIKTSLKTLVILRLLALITTNKVLQAETEKQEIAELPTKEKEKQQYLNNTSHNQFTEILFSNNTLPHLDNEEAILTRETINFHSENIDLRQHSENNASSLGYITDMMKANQSSDFMRPEDAENLSIEDYDQNVNNISLYYHYYYEYEDNDFGENVLRQISFTKTLYFCEYIFSAMYGEYTSFQDSFISYDNKSVTVIHDEKFKDVCAPFFDIYNKNCSNMGAYTFCADENVLFLNKQECKKPSDNDVHFEHLLAAALLADDETCFQSVCNGNIRIIDHVLNGILIRVFHTEENGKQTICHDILQNYYVKNEREEVYGLKNVHWPSCYPDHTFILAEDPQEHEMLRSWNYLPPNCQSYEMTILVIISIIIVTGIIGNITVIITLLGKQCSSIGLELHRISLAFSDLFVCLFVITPALYTHLMLMNGSSDEVMKFKSQKDILNHLKYSQDEIPDNSGHLISAFVFSCCAINSIHIIFALSYKGLRDNVRLKFLCGLPPLNTEISVGSFWIVSLLTSFIIMHDDNGFSTEWNSYAKLPEGVSVKGKKVVLPMLMAVLGIECLITIIISALAVYYHKKQQKRGETTTDDLEENLTLPMAIMTILFTIYSVSGGTATYINLKDMRFYQSELVSSMCWWIFLSSTSWNPWLYYLSRRKYRNGAIQRLKAIIAAICWGGSWETFPNSSNQSRHGAQSVNQYSSQQYLRTISSSIEERVTNNEVSV
ncbi:uncharacterized protein [Palaemon carinicauda]|uniref:uncharacterized protein n=1 Tax=Palaemon carinicauda TaxID=392227 RepID=UPI0035B6A8C6